MQDNSQKPTTRALLAPLLTPISGTALFALGGAGWLVLTRQMGVDLSPWLGVGLSSSLAYMLLRLTQPRDADGAPTLDDLPEAVFLVDAKGRITQWNQRAETLAGGPIFESGQPYQEIVPEDCRATFEQAVEQGRRTGLFGFETRLSTEDGTSVPCQGRAKPLLGKRGQAQGMTITLRAVGRHQQLAEREAGFRQMVEMAPYLVGIVTEGRISWLNSSGII